MHNFTERSSKVDQMPTKHIFHPHLFKWSLENTKIVKIIPTLLIKAKNKQKTFPESSTKLYINYKLALINH